MQESVYPAGTVLKIRCSTYWHYGLADGQGNVIHNSKKWRRVSLDTETDFAEGHTIRVSRIGSDAPHLAVSHALSQIGRPYNLLDQNCEQFVREAHGLPIECTQFQRLVVAAAGGYITLSASTPILKIAGVGIMLGAVASTSERSPYKKAVLGAKIAVGSSLLISTIARRLAKPL
ncbi:lecithin retinol acyltransferase family protein [Photobacterium minamisatsumaniensis]|uniref:lecithin retinol acyltransferase family protein n=1 Tax=Photobacterium minamisatsumaniensis TaxID=2910233 RepID=UPI003D10EECD